jgi:putative heme-binding domain-containing protein
MTLSGNAPLSYLATVPALGCLIFATSQLTWGQERGYRGAQEPATPSEVYGEGVRSTSWLSPAQEQSGFHLPPGFKIELFASEPQIAKPLNMAWDARGRLWVTSSREYPYPAAADKPARDTLQILEDTDGDGRADKSTTFADGLNIPIGVLPVAQGAICYSIPYVWLLRDTDGDDRADQRIKLLGPFDTSRDTHGMVNSLTRGDNGWIYACHGFNNQSDVTATDGSRVRLMSGNTFRFREDGSRIEQVTQGQVNPFGMTRDEWGNWYSADCHSKPLTALLPGACYPSFGRPDDGLGFAPAMMDHLHGSTAICGLNYYQAEHFPAAYRRLFYSGNVMTSRINCNALTWQGSTAQATELPDFLTSDDPWFRPVDIQLGPDGALYVADFYNKIIGHYEVPLDHPGRDRDSGRIWRISYVGDAADRSSAANAVPDAPQVTMAIDVAQVQAELASPNETRRRLAVETALQAGADTTEMALVALHDASRPERLRLSCLEILFRRGRFDATHTLPLSTDDLHPHLLASQLTLACELPSQVRSKFAEQMSLQLPYANPQLERAATRLLGDTQDMAHLDQLALTAGLNHDPALHHTARIALKNILRVGSQVTEAMTLSQGTPTESQIVHILPAIDSEQSAKHLLTYVAQHPEAPSRLEQAAIGLATKHATEPLIEQLLEVLQTTHANDLKAQVLQLETICASTLSTHAHLPNALKKFGADLQAQLLERLAQHTTQPAPIRLSDASGSDWAREPRLTSQRAQIELRSSFTRGESYTGSLVSETLACPAELSFWIAGHNGLPAQPDRGQNRIELQLVATGAALHWAAPPRSDIAQRVTWKMPQHVGQPVRIVVTDGDSGKAYAWLAVGGFSLDALEPDPAENYFESLLVVVRRGFAPLEPAMLEPLKLPTRSSALLVAAGLQGALAPTAGSLVTQAIKLGRAESVDLSLLQAHSADDLLPLAQQLALTATSREQRVWVSELVRSSDGCRILEQLLGAGLISLSSLPREEVLWPGGLAENSRLFLQTQLELAQTAAEDFPSVSQRIAKLDWSTGDRLLGQHVYQQHCAACHQLRGAGSVIGPQLDGAVARGVERLCEDILAPNLNVDKAFRVSALLLDDDSVLSGLVREMADGAVLFTGQDGRTQQLPAARIQSRRDTQQSLMPSNFGELLSDQQLTALMAFLTRAD